MIKSNGTNVFENNTFSWASWSADILQSPQEVSNVFDQLSILNEKIVSIIAVGFAYNLHAEYFEEETSDSWEETCSDDMHPVVLEIDEPLIFVFASGNRFEIDFSEGSCVRISKNSLPIDIQPGVNRKIFDANKLFASCLGSLICGVEIKATNVPPVFTGSYGWHLSENLDEYVERISLLLDNSTKIEFSPFCDYGYVQVVNDRNEPLMMKVQDLRLTSLDT